jgi:hypothetical protein
LIAFNEYVNEQLNALTSETTNTVQFTFPQTFKSWIEQHQEIWTLFEEFRSDPKTKAFSEDDFVNVLSLKQPTSEALKLNLVDENTRVATDAAQAVILNRTNSVLGRGTILKSDHFPGCHKKYLAKSFKGAPNFRQVDRNIPIYGLGNPTIEGIETVLKEIGSNRHFIWTSLREEPVIFING